MEPRTRFECVKCGVKIVGRLNPKNGKVYAYDRSATDETVPVKPCLCSWCAEQTADAPR